MGQLVSDVEKILDYKESKKTAENERQKILSQMAQDESEKINLIKKVLSAQRAKYGASGRSSRGLTEEAVLKRIQSETEKPYETKKKTNLNKLKNTKATKKNLVLSVLQHFDKLIG